MDQAAIALPKRLLRIKRQAARLADLNCLRASAQLQQVVQAEQVAQDRMSVAEALLRERCLELRLIEEVHASRHEIQGLAQEIKQLQAKIETARAAYQAALNERRHADAEVEVMEKLLERRQEELHRKLEQRKQQFADEWTMRKWTGSDAVGQEAAQ
jgi:hypothetical protein